MTKSLDWQSILGGHPLFSSLSTEEIEKLLADEVSNERDCPKDYVILREGESGDSIFLIGSGEVSVVSLRKGDHKIPLCTLRTGEFFGEMALFERRPRFATVITKERCSLLEIKGQKFLELMREHPDIQFKVLLILSERLRHASEQVLAVTLNDVDEKLDIFSTQLQERLKAQLKAADAQLQASQVVYDQINAKANQAIKNAEAIKTNLTAIGSTIVAVGTIIIGALGYFGYTEFVKVQEFAGKASEFAGEASGYAEKAKGKLKKLDDLDVLVVKMRVEFAGSILLEAFQAALKRGDDDRAKHYYEEISNVTSDVTSDKSLVYTSDKSLIDSLISELPKINRLLFEIEGTMTEFKDQNGAPPINFAGVLGSIFENTATPKDTIQCAYLLLTNMIINNLEEVAIGAKWKKYDEILSQLEETVENEKNHGVTADAGLAELIGESGKQRFCAMLKLVPLDDQKEEVKFCGT